MFTLPFTLHPLRWALSQFTANTAVQQEATSQIAQWLLPPFGVILPCNAPAVTLVC